MRKIKFSKSEYVLLFNTIGVLVSLALLLMGNIQTTDTNSAKIFSFQGYAAIASVCFCIFVPLNSELHNKRWPTKKEKNYTYLVYFAVSSICFVVEGYPLENLIIFIFTSVFWLILKIVGAHTLPEDIDKEEPICSDPYYYENEEKTLEDFGANVSWYSKKKEKQLRSIYKNCQRILREEVKEIEQYVQNRVMMAKLRGPKTATCIFLVGVGLFVFLMPILGNKYFATVVYILAPFQFYGIFAFIKDSHDPLTPWESEELARKDTVEKVGKDPVTIYNEHSSTKKDSWTDTRLDVIFNKSGKSFLSLCDVKKILLKRAGGVDIFWLLMSVAFSAPVIPFLILCIAMNAEWFWYVIFVGIYGVVGAVFTYVFIKTEKERRKFIKSFPAEIRLSLINCIDLQSDYVSDPETPIYQLFSDSGNYRIYSDAYEKLNKGDKLAFVRIKDYCFAFPLKYWEIEGFSNLQ